MWSASHRNYTKIYRRKWNIKFIIIVKSLAYNIMIIISRIINYVVFKWKVNENTHANKHQFQELQDMLSSFCGSFNFKHSTSKAILLTLHILTQLICIFRKLNKLPILLLNSSLYTKKGIKSNVKPIIHFLDIHLRLWFRICPVIICFFLMNILNQIY